MRWRWKRGRKPRFRRSPFGMRNNRIGTISVGFGKTIVVVVVVVAVVVGWTT